jgi:alpha-L-rhamnosidase
LAVWLRSAGGSLLAFLKDDTIMKKISFLIVLCIGMSARSQTLPAPLHLRTDLLLHTGQVNKNGVQVNLSLSLAISSGSGYEYPVVLNPEPVFHWQTDLLVKKTTAYQILVASSENLLQQNTADYWDSKKINSVHSLTKYSGRPLQPGKIYYWKLKVWDDKNNPSPFSSTVSFYTKAADDMDAFSHYPLSAEVQKPVMISKKNNRKWLVDFGKDAFAQITLQLNTDKADSVWIEAAEALDSNGDIQRLPGNIRYTKRSIWVEKGTHSYTILWPADAKRNSRNPIQMPDYIGEVFPFRYLVISNFSGIIDQSSVNRKMIHYPFDEKASSFQSSDTVLNQVWDLCRYSVKATSFTGYYVDGDRERLPYEADALINQLSHYAVDAEYSMARRSMDYVIFHPTWPTEWSLQNVLLAWNDYMYTGDDSFLRKYYTQLQKKILMPLAGPNKLISTKAKKQADDFLESIHMVKDFDGKHGLKDNVDWPQKGNYIGNEKEYAGETDGFVYADYNAVINAFYYRCLVLMSKIAATIGKPGDAVFYQTEAAELYRSYQNIFVDPQTHLVKDGDTTNHTSLHSNMFALAFGLVPKENIRPVLDFIKTRKMACSVYGAQFLLDALYDAGEDNYAVQLMSATTQRSWYNMIRTGSTITMEAWDKLYKPNLDLNHAWGSAPANIIVRKLMGVEPLTPGFDLFQIKPQTGSLSFARLKTRCIKGDISVNWQQSATADTWEILIPGASVASISLPFKVSHKEIEIDGKTAKPDHDAHFWVLGNLAAGKHLIRIKK